MLQGGAPRIAAQQTRTSGETQSQSQHPNGSQHAPLNPRPHLRRLGDSPHRRPTAPAPANQSFPFVASLIPRLRILKGEPLKRVFGYFLHEQKVTAESGAAQVPGSRIESAAPRPAGPQLPFYRQLLPLGTNCPRQSPTSPWSTARQPLKYTCATDPLVRHPS